jgi:hypothetical protein
MKTTYSTIIENFAPQVTQEIASHEVPQLILRDKPKRE